MGKNYYRLTLPILAIALGLNFSTAVVVAPSKAWGQTTIQTVDAGSITGALEQSALPGADFNAIAATLTSSAATQSTLAQVLANINSNTGVSPTSAGGLIGGILNGTISNSVATTLASTPGLGNLTTIPSIINALAPLESSLQSITDLTAQAQALTSSLAVLMGPDALSQLASSSTLQRQLATALSSSYPELAQSMGGILGFAAQLGNLAGLLETMTPEQIIVGLLTGTLGSLGVGIGSVSGGTDGPQNSLTKSTLGSPYDCCHRVNTEIPKHYFNLRAHANEEFVKYRTWFLGTFWTENMLPALMRMAQQLSVTGIKQVEAIGTLLDAKHQLETQRLFQEMTAQAHKDYQPSEGMCTFGTAVRSLAASERLSDLSQTVLAERMMERQTLNGKNIATDGPVSDFRSRLKQYTETYCSKADNAGGLADICQATGDDVRPNMDINYTRSLENKLTLDINFRDSNIRPDEQDLFALNANLFSSELLPTIDKNYLGDGKTKIRLAAVEALMDSRSLYAQRSVALNSIASIAAERASGDAGSAPYTKALIRELGIDNEDDINKILGTRPSYFAQMEVLTKKVYQNPTFYTELYDKPVNIDRKGAALQAIGLMQDRDIYNSLIRSEAVLSVLLETMLEKEQDKIQNASKVLNTSGK